MATASEKKTVDVIDSLYRIYESHIKPLEMKYKYADFYHPYLTPSDFKAKPMVLLLGQYSVGKTSFINFLLGREFPGMRIGPEPTTDRFVAVMHGREDRTIPGSALSVHKDLPFTSVTKFGTSFLNKFEAAEMNADLLRSVSLIDTPGVLSGQKQRIGRSYDFPSVVEWFAERADLILLLFDAHKLDISDEFKSTIKALKGHDDKIRVILNKADQVTPQQLMRVYGAMMWSLGKVVNTPEVMRVYIGSFWNKPYQNENFKELFQAEQGDLIRDLRDLPRNAAIRKINELVKRARLAKVHALIIGHLRSKLPVFGKEKKQAKLLANLADEFFEVMRQHRLPQGDFPPLKRFQQVAETFKFSEFPKVDQKLMDAMDRVLSVDIPQLLQSLQDDRSQVLSQARMGAALTRIGKHGEEREPEAAGGGGGGGGGGNPFGDSMGGSGKSWEELVKKEIAEEEFVKIGPNANGKLSGADVKGLMMDSGLDNTDLFKIWDLSDIDRDGALDEDEFAVMLYLIREAKEGKPVPSILPREAVPPSKSL